MSLRVVLSFAVAIAAGVLQAQVATAQSCTAITSLPAVLSQPGKYCLVQNLRYEGAIPVSGQLDNAITVTSDDVTVDLNGYTLLGGANASVNPGSAGIRAGDRNNVRVMNGAIRNFGNGVQLSDLSGGITPANYSIEQVLVDGALLSGLGIAGRHATLRGNRVTNLSSTSTTYSGVGIVVYGTAARVIDNSVANIVSANTPAIGIAVDAAEARVENNSVSAINPGKVGIGLMMSANASGSVIKGNTFSNAAGSVGMGILAGNPTVNLTIDANFITGFATGISMSGSTTSKYRNNTVIGATTAYYGGINIGGNN